MKASLDYYVYHLVYSTTMISREELAGNNNNDPHSFQNNENTHTIPMLLPLNNSYKKKLL